MDKQLSFKIVGYCGLKEIYKKWIEKIKVNKGKKPKFYWQKFVKQQTTLIIGSYTHINT